jgi:hypothetical protein
MPKLTIDTWYHERVFAERQDFTAANITAVTVLKSRPTLLVAALLWLRYKLRKPPLFK